MDVYLALGFGVFGYIVKKYEFPMAPMVLGIVLGKIMESNLRRSLLMSHNDFSIFFSRPLSTTLIFLEILSFLYPLYQDWRVKRKEHKRKKTI